MICALWTKLTAMPKPFTFRLSRLVGNRRFVEAIAHLRDGLDGSDNDLAALEMIALCQQWAQHNEDAEATCRQSLQRFPSSFELHKLLGELLATKGEDDEAIVHVRQALLLVPEPLPKLPSAMFSTLAFINRHLFRLQTSATDVETHFRSGERTNLEWVAWANVYSDWYDATYGSKQH